MGEPQRIPRRPAILDYAQTEAIVGAPDVADSSVLAHSTAWALLGVGDEDFDPEALRRLRELLSTGGVPLVAELWSQSPDFTLPGALWRVYLFREWFHRDPLTVAELYILGLHADQVPGLEEPIHARPLEDVIHDADALLSGKNVMMIWKTSLRSLRMRCALLLLAIPEWEDSGSMTRMMLWRTE